MARIAGINIPVQKHAVIALTSIYGIGHSRAEKICVASKVKPTTKVKDLTDAEVETLRREIVAHGGKVDGIVLNRQKGDARVADRFAG